MKKQIRLFVVSLTFGLTSFAVEPPLDCKVEYKIQNKKHEVISSAEGRIECHPGFNTACDSYFHTAFLHGLRMDVSLGKGLNDLIWAHITTINSSGEVNQLATASFPNQFKSTLSLRGSAPLDRELLAVVNVACRSK